MDRVTNMVESMARAAFEAMQRRVQSTADAPPFIGPWEDESERLREDWRAAMRAAIETMPVPGLHPAGGHFERTGTGRGNRKWIPRP